jgi:hypothetical protein
MTVTIKIEPRFKMFMLLAVKNGVDFWGYIPYPEYLPGTMEYKSRQIMEDIFVKYVEFVKDDVVYRIVKNPKYKMEGYN